jgi:hypothetical protein
MRYLFICMIAFGSLKLNAQGCVSIRSNGGSCNISQPESRQANSWILAFNYRYFRSYKHFVGTEEQKKRVEEGSEVINHANLFEIAATKILNKRWSMSFYLPVSSYTRSSLYEHSGKKRYSTSAFGLGDVRLGAGYWLIDPAAHSKFNVQIGMGLKLPTGDDSYQDYFHKSDTVMILGPVDQSIQLGDGGTGITSDLNFFYMLSSRFNLYLNAFYLLNPREQNGVSTARGGVPSAANIANGSQVMSVPDQYMWRMGGSYAVHQFNFSGGVRMECLPVYDLVGGSNGFRRPGYVLSAEPSLSYKGKKCTGYISVPWAIERNRKQSVPDKIRSEQINKYVHGDAAFADYTINVGISFLLK